MRPPTRHGRAHGRSSTVGMMLSRFAARSVASATLKIVLFASAAGLVSFVFTLPGAVIALVRYVVFDRMGMAQYLTIFLLLCVPTISFPDVRSRMHVHACTHRQLGVVSVAARIVLLAGVTRYSAVLRDRRWSVFSTLAARVSDDTDGCPGVGRDALSHLGPSGGFRVAAKSCALLATPTFWHVLPHRVIHQYRTRAAIPSPLSTRRDRHSI